MTADRSGWTVHGRPTHAELAAVVAVLSAAGSFGGPAAGTQSESGGGWSAYWRGLRDPVATGPGAWRASGWPR